MNPKRVPQMAGTDEVFQRIERSPGTTYTGLVGNLKGAQRAVEARVDEVNVVVAASETFNRVNGRWSVEESLEEFRAIVETCKAQGIGSWFSVATAFGCPFEGEVPLDRVLVLAGRALDLGAGGITLADTTGMAHPKQVFQVVSAFFQRFGDQELVLHFHNTRGMGLANVLAAMEAGARTFHASIGGLGGCPFAPGLPTEDLVHMLDGMGIGTGVDLDRLLALARRLEERVGQPLPDRCYGLASGPISTRPPTEARPETTHAKEVREMRRAYREPAALAVALLMVTGLMVGSVAAQEYDPNRAVE